MLKTTSPINRLLASSVLTVLLVHAVGCSTLVGPSAVLSQPDKASLNAAPPFARWQHYPLPGKEPTEFAIIQMDGRDVVLASADASASMLRQPVRVESSDLGAIGFSWKVPQLIERADMAVRQTDDSPVRVVLAFEGDRSSFSMKNAMLSELSLTLTGEPLPYATLMYVWSNSRPIDTVITNPRTDRIRKIVVESGATGLNNWLRYDRNIRADFEKAFGELPGALVGIGIMTDTDNTKTKAQAWYGPLNLTAAK